MTRQIALECQACRRKFGGDQTERRHRIIAGDRFRCRSDEELREAGMRQDRLGVWRRGENPNQQALTLSDSPTDVFEPSIVATPSKLLSRATGPATSYLAAALAAPKTGTYKRALLDAIRASDGLTFEEAARRVGMDPWQASKRVSELKREGLVRVVGERAGSSGRLQEVVA